MISFRNITHRPDQESQPILSNFSLDLDDNQLTVLLGESGTGKSTLALMLAGYLKPESGDILLNDSPREYSENSIGLLQQNPEHQILGTTVERDIAFGLENQNVNRAEMQNLVGSLIARFDLESCRSKAPGEISGGEKQRTAIAGLMAAGASYLILDEPTSYLDRESREELISYVQQLTKSGVGVLWITQYPEEAVLGERVIILGDEGILSDESPDEFTMRESINGTLEPETQVRTDILWEKPVVKIESLLEKPYPDNFLISVDSLRVHSGERQGWYGSSGSGKSTLAKLLAGILPAPSGSIGTHCENHEIVYVPQFAEQMLYSGAMDQTLEFLQQRPNFDIRDYRAILNEQLNGLGIKPEGVYSRPIWTFSGGEQRRIVLAVAFALRPKVLILDEPTIGISPGDRDKLNHLFTSDAIPAIICISHEYEYLRRITQTGAYFESGTVSVPRQWDDLEIQYNLQDIEASHYATEGNKLLQIL